MVKRHHLALPKEDPEQKEAQREPAPKEKTGKSRPQPKSAPAKHQPAPEEKSTAPSVKKEASPHPQQPKTKNTAPEPEEKAEPKTAPTKNASSAAQKPAPHNQKQAQGSYPTEPKGKTTAKEPQQEAEPKSAPKTAPTKTMPVKSTPSEKEPAEAKEKEPVQPKGKKASQAEQEVEGKSTPAKKGPSTAPTKSAPQKKPTKQSEEQEEPKGSNSKGKEQEPKGKTFVPVPISSKSSSSSSPALKSSSPPVSHSPPPHQVSSSSPSTNSQPKFLGISTAFLINLAIILAVVAIVVFIIIKLYQRYRTRQDYNETPENFAHKPVLGFNEEYYLSHNKIERVIAPQRITINEQNPINGKIWQVEFKGTEKSAVYFHRRQNTTTYFEVEVISVHGSIEIGFVPVSSFAQLKSGEENIGNSGVGVTNSGYIQAQGENIYNYSWILVYGDVFGIGLTRENSKFSERRAWISKNGVLLNYPPNDEMDRWLATIEISAEQKAEYNLGTEKKENEEQEQEKEDQEKAKEKLQKQKVEGLLRKQRISLKTFNKFQYYPVIVCHGNKDQDASTIINVNVGGQVFRMFDAQFRSGLLKDKSLFGDD